MRRLSLPLLVLAQQCLARQHPFTIHDDIFAHPQFDVVFADGFISEQDAQSLVDRSTAQPTYNADFSSQSDLAHRIHAAGAKDGNPGADANDDDDEERGYNYEFMNRPPYRYLCSIPAMDDAQPENHTAAELARADEAREIDRASRRGWELMRPMEGQCLHFMSGWWSYRFCYGKDIVQYHALPQMPHGQAPVQDPSTLSYVLGRVPPEEQKAAKDWQQQQQQKQGEGGKDSTGEAGTQEQVQPHNAELEIKGDQRYLVQRLGHGTLCDLTMRERTIEIQYHCAPTVKADRIAWIKEVTTCAYVMLINTPRLCDDVAFLPPQEVAADPITCQRVGDAEADDPRAPLKGIDGGKAQADKSDQVLGSHKPGTYHPPVIGGIIVGGQNILASGGDGGKAVKLELPRNYLPAGQAGAGAGGTSPKKAKPRAEPIASRQSKSDGGKEWSLTKEELTNMGLNAREVEDLKRKLRSIGGDRAWKLEVVRLANGEREIRGVIDVDDVKEDKKGKKGGGKAADGEGAPGKAAEGRKAQDDQGQGQGHGEEGEYEDIIEFYYEYEDEGDVERDDGEFGSEELFFEEL